MNKYELTVIFKPNLGEEVLKAEFEKVTGYISRFGGTVEKVDELGKRRLAYEIQKVNDGIYYYITFNSEAGTPAEVESRLRIMESLLRFLIIKCEA